MNLEQKVKNRFNISEILKNLLNKVSKIEKNLITGGSSRPYKVFTGTLYASTSFEDMSTEKENTIGVLSLTRVSEREFKIDLPNLIDYPNLFIVPTTGMIADLSGVGVPGGGYSDSFVPIHFILETIVSGVYITDGIRLIIPSGYTLPTSYNIQFSLEYRIYN